MGITVLVHTLALQIAAADVKAAAEGDTAPAKKPLKVVMYKGQRKVLIDIGDEVPLTAQQVA